MCLENRSRKVANLSLGNNSILTCIKELAIFGLFDPDMLEEIILKHSPSLISFLHNIFIIIIIKRNQTEFIESTFL